ncbi:MAG: PAS domain-containing protein [Candidatus Micrarchaeota archaeon]|nr:PAS domain-containing protein [Candidatus Micrarchaeota archaeon]
MQQENFLISKMLQGIISAANSASIEEGSDRRFARMIGEFFGVEKVTILPTSREKNPDSELFGYVYNTKKPYVDNQLSEYSSFQELIGYKNRGFRSCAVIPIVVDGNVVSMVEMLSTSENKFSELLLNGASFGAYLAGITMLYKSESERSIRLASYFNSAFSVAESQLLVSNDGKIVKSNDAARKEILDQKSPEGRRIENAIGLDFAKLATLSKSRGTIIQLEKGGRTRYYSLSVGMIGDRLADISLRDVTELKRLALMEQSMDNESYVSALYLDGNLEVRSATDSIKKAIGYDKNLIIGKTLTELTTEKRRGELKELLEKNASSERLHGSIDLVSATGIPSHLRFVLSKWANGYLMLLSDATSEGYAESISNAFNDFIKGTSDAVITMDALGYVKDCNMPAENVLGYSRSELIGRELRSIYSDQSIFDRDITYVRNGGKIDNSYVTLLSKGKNADGSDMVTDATHSIRLFSGTDVADYIIVIKELETKRKLRDYKEAIAKAESRIQRLEATSGLKSQFIHNISHELKTPLTNIKGFSKLLYSGEFGSLNKEQLDCLATIMEEGDRLMFIIQQVLDAAKLESKKMKLEIREVDMKELGSNPTIQALMESPMAREKGLKFAWKVEDDVPKIMADPSRLVQAFTNLINNAIKFTNEGRISVSIKRKSKSMIQCDVEDTGIGISEEDRHKLFKNFYEAPKKGLLKQEASGTGLGLSITKQIVMLHGGKIACSRSELGNGSTFTFTLRVKPKQKKERSNVNAAGSVS